MRHGEDVATRSLTALHSAPDGLLHPPVLPGVAVRGALAPGAGIAAKGDELEGDDSPPPRCPW